MEARGSIYRVNNTGPRIDACGTPQYRDHISFFGVWGKMLWVTGLTGLPEYELPHTVVARLQASPGLPGYELPHTVVARLQASPAFLVMGFYMSGYRPHLAFLNVTGLTGLPEYELPHAVVARSLSVQIPDTFSDEWKQQEGKGQRRKCREKKREVGLMRLALQDASWLGPGEDPPSDLDMAEVHLTSGNGESC
ncbi:hypothetical protein PO909_023560 [Leuciscus waleckii]